MSTPMNQLFDSIHKLPQIPEVVQAIIQQLNDPKTEMLDIAKNVAKEQVIAIKILRLVNSAHFGLSRKIGSIEEATTLLGLSQLKMLVIASGIVSTIPKIDHFDIRNFWNNTFRTAAYAKWLAEKAQLSGDVAYTAGLIANLGQILIRMSNPAVAIEIDQWVKTYGKPLSEIEQEKLGFTNQDVCAELCRRWKFADELVTAIQQSGNPLAHEQVSGLGCILHLAQFISKGVDEGKTEEDILNEFPFPVANEVGLVEAFAKAKLTEILSIKSNLEGLAD